MVAVIPIEPAQREASARAAKALKLYRMLEQHGMTGDARLMQPEHWRMLATAAGTREPSAKTIAIVIELCEEWV